MSRAVCSVPGLQEGLCRALVESRVPVQQGHTAVLLSHGLRLRTSEAARPSCPLGRELRHGTERGRGNGSVSPPWERVLLGLHETSF